MGACLGKSDDFRRSGAGCTQESTGAPTGKVTVVIDGAGRAETEPPRVHQTLLAATLSAEAAEAKAEQKSRVRMGPKAWKWLKSKTCKTAQEETGAFAIQADPALRVQNKSQSPPVIPISSMARESSSSIDKDVVGRGTSRAETADKTDEPLARPSVAEYVRMFEQRVSMSSYVTESVATDIAKTVGSKVGPVIPLDTGGLQDGCQEAPAPLGGHWGDLVASGRITAAQGVRQGRLKRLNVEQQTRDLVKASVVG